MQKQVVIIGAGPSGLAALKEMRGAGLDAIVFEKADTFGGVFRKGNQNTYEDLYLTTSNLFTAFSDFPSLEEYMKYSSKEEYNRYLAAYVDAFDLLPHIEFNHQVICAEMNQERVWEIELKRKDGTVIHVRAEHLVVATGSQNIPSTPQLEGYTGELLHASQYREKEAFEGKRVLIIGIGESASDIAAEVSSVAKETVVWSRRPFLVAPRFPPAAFTTAGYDEQDILQNEAADYADANQFLEFGTVPRLANTMSFFAHTLMRVIFFTFFNRASFTPGYARKVLSWYQMVFDLNFWRSDQSMVVTKNGRLIALDYLDKLAVIVSKSIKFSGKQAEFHDVMLNKLEQRRFEFDVVIACTGYKTQFDWLKADVQPNPRTWFKQCFPPSYGEKLMFLGWVRGHNGGITVMAEMLARYGALLIAGQRGLPPNIVALAAQEAEKSKRYYINSPDLHTLSDYFAFMESISKLIGCQPKMPNPLTDWNLFVKYWVYPNWACWYRKDGPGANREALNAFLSKAKMAYREAVPVVGVQLLLTIPSLPLYCVYKLMTLLGFERQEGFGFGWRFMRPKGTLLHNNSWSQPPALNHTNQPV
ncbi:MAG: NAD(P)-binding domain-containing protein [Chloroflexota bacterium]